MATAATRRVGDSSNQDAEDSFVLSDVNRRELHAFEQLPRAGVVVRLDVLFCWVLILWRATGDEENSRASTLR